MAGDKQPVAGNAIDIKDFFTKAGNTTGKETGGNGIAGGGPSAPGAETGTGTKAKEEKPIRDVVVEIPQPKEPKKKQTKAKQTAPAVDSTAIEAFLGMVFDFISLRLGSIWKLQPEEAKQIAEPLSRILGRLEQSEMLMKNMDYVSLVTALGMVLIPRVLMTKPKKKEAPKNEGTVVGGSQRDAGTGNGPAPAIADTTLKGILEQLSQ